MTSPSPELLHAGGTSTPSTPRVGQRPPVLDVVRGAAPTRILFANLVAITGVAVFYADG